MIKFYIYENGKCHTYNQYQQGTIKNFTFKVNEKEVELSWDTGNTILKPNQALEMEDLRFMLVLHELPWKMITFKKNVKIGRSVKNEICIPNEHISSHHLSLETKGNQIVIKDLGSTNGTYCDGKQIEQIQVEEGTIILVACVEMIVFSHFVLCRNFDQNHIQQSKKEVIPFNPLVPHHGILNVQISVETLELEIPHLGYENESISIFQSIGPSLLIFLSSLVSTSILYFSNPSSSSILPTMVSNGAMVFSFLLFGIYNFRKNKKNSFHRQIRNKEKYFAYLKEKESFLWQRRHQILCEVENIKEKCTNFLDEDYGKSHPLFVGFSLQPWIQIQHPSIGYEHQHDSLYQELVKLGNIQKQSILMPQFWQKNQSVFLPEGNKNIVYWLFLQFIWQCPKKNDKWIWIGPSMDPTDKVFSFPQCQSQTKRLWIRDKSELFQLEKWLNQYPDAHVVSFEDWPLSLDIDIHYLCIVKEMKDEEMDIETDSLSLDSISFPYYFRNLLSQYATQTIPSFASTLPDFSLKSYQYKPKEEVQLCVPIGIGQQNQILYLDFHDKKQGPHGLIAGMTGSGKSEWMGALLMSLVLHNSSKFFQYILIDFKGGAFGQNFYDFPHCAGMLTNMQPGQIDRFFLSLDYEIHSRQKRLEDILSKQSGLTYHIDTYNRFSKNPMSHLFLIVDEFAQLKSKHPEYMDRLKEIARIGRSLGIHLLLATQKPMGVIDEQIWSNSNFKICFRVNSKSDSQEVIKSDKAYRLDEVGQFVLQVGNESDIAGKGFYLQEGIEPDACIWKEMDDWDHVIDTSSTSYISIIQYFSKKVKEVKERQSWVVLPDLSLYQDWKEEIFQIDCPRQQIQIPIELKRGSQFFVHYERKEDVYSFVSSLLLSNEKERKYVFGTMEFEDLVDQSFENLEEVKGMEGIVVVFLEKEKMISWVYQHAFHKNIGLIVVSTSVKQAFIKLANHCQYQLSLFDKNIDDIRLYFNQHAIPSISPNESRGLIRWNQQLEYFYYPIRQTKELSREKIELEVDYGIFLGLDSLSSQRVCWDKKQTLVVCFVQQSMKEEIEKWLSSLEGIVVGKSLEENVDLIVVNALFQEDFFHSPEYKYYQYDVDILWVGSGLQDYTYLIKRQIPMERSGNAIYYSQNEVRSFTFPCQKS